MRKLMRANLFTLRKSKVFYLACTGMAGAALFLIAQKYTMLLRSGPDNILDDIFFSVFIALGIAIAVFTSFFTGAEHSDGTLRNKVIMGARRRDIYLANFLTACLAGLLMTATFFLVMCAVGMPLLGPLHMALPNAFKLVGLGILANCTYAAIFTLLAMLLHNKAFSVLVCGALILVLIITGANTDNRLREPEFTVGGIMISEGQVQHNTTPVPNPMYLEGDQRVLYQFYLDLLPTGQSIQIMKGSMPNPWQMALYSCVLTALFTGVGILLFKRRDLK